MQRELFFILMDDRYLPNGKTTAKRKNQGMRFQFLPLSKPAPPIFFQDQQFCFTGRFAWGSRKQCEAETRSRGGSTQVNVTQETNFLIIGSIGSRDWLHSTHGRKIEYAQKLTSSEFPIAIVSEEHWVDHLL
jgi:NAD-dependent DNA ligase